MHKIEFRMILCFFKRL